MPEYRERYNAVVIVTSDTCALDPSKDESGQFVVNKLIQSCFFDKVSKNIVKDDQRSITNCVKKALADAKNALIITVGGTGLCPRDVTPEATKVLYERECTGIAAALHAAGLRYSANAALSRLTSGLVGNCLIVNFPGGMKACKDCISCLLAFLEHALEQIRFDAAAIAHTHNQLALHYTSIDCEAKEEIMPREIHPVIADLMSGLRTYRSEEASPALSYLQSPAIENIPDSTSSIRISAIEKPIRQQSQYPIFEYDEALKVMSAYSKDLSPATLIEVTNIEALQDLVGDVLAEDVSPSKAVPKYSVSTMDGFILHVPASIPKSQVAKIKMIRTSLLSEQEFEARRNDEKYASGNFFCCRVNTGGRVPEKDFAVIPVEMTDPVTKENLLPIREINLNQYIRAAGSDMNHNDVIKAGTRLGPAELATLLSLGHRRICVSKKPKLAVISTGDELIDPYEETNNNVGVIDINGPLLNLVFHSRGYCVENMGIVRDVPEDILMKLRQSLDRCDILLVTGGASMGSKDYVKDTIEQLGGTIRFGRVNIKPGKPAAFATIDHKGKRKYIFSLPGNPVSAFVTAFVLVIPFIEHGLRNHFEPDLELSLNLIGAMISVKIASLCDGDEDNHYVFDGRLEFARARFRNDSIDGDSVRSVVVSVKQQSSRMLTLVDCDCLIIIDPDLKGSRFQVGQTYRALVLKK